MRIQLPRSTVTQEGRQPYGKNYSHKYYAKKARKVPNNWINHAGTQLYKTNKPNRWLEVEPIRGILMRSDSKNHTKINQSWNLKELTRSYIKHKTKEEQSPRDKNECDNRLWWNPEYQQRIIVNIFQNDRKTSILISEYIPWMHPL